MKLSPLWQMIWILHELFTLYEIGLQQLTPEKLVEVRENSHAQSIPCSA
jgi:hypothetical protein